jgi:DNA mismatch endonuclease (patch repair protein)
MPDVLTSAQRSFNMSRIRGRGNATTELRLISLMREWQITGWRRGLPVYGHPDFVFPAERLAIFVDGCYWHGCPVCKYRPATNREFWSRKIGGNRRRDLRVTRTLRRAGYGVLRIWEHQLRRPEVVVRAVRKALRQRYRAHRT